MKPALTPKPVSARANKPVRVRPGPGMAAFIAEKSIDPALTPMTAKSTNKHSIPACMQMM